ncbi:hypothetical protein [Phage f2b1]|nr:hypothetical protein [Phage f2b1]
MTVQFNLNEEVKGYKIVEITGGGFYRAQKDGVVICFYTTAGDGKNYCRIQSVYNTNNGRYYSSPRFFTKYIAEIQALSSELFFRHEESLTAEENKEDESVNVTEMETAVMNTIKNTMDMYCDGFSDVRTADIAEETGYTMSQVKGVLSSLQKKGYVYFMDVNNEYNVFALTTIGADAMGYELEYYEELMTS